MFSFLPVAIADEAAQSSASLPQESVLMNFVPIILIFLIFYFLLIRPQVKKQKEQQALVSSVKRGDKVVIAGGIVGTYLKEEDGGIVEIELAKDVQIKALKQTITSVLNKTTSTPAVIEKKIKKVKK